MEKTECVDNELSMYIMEDTVRYGGMLLKYSLGVHCRADGRSFEILVVNGDERCSCQVGEDLLFATDCYRSLLWGRVTPCSAQDVIEDLSYLRKNHRKM